MLCNDLYQLLSLAGSDGNYEARVRLLRESAVYAAHFPGMPVTPGACLVEMAAELASVAAGTSLDVCGAPDIRFLQVILPDGTDELVFRLEGTVPEETPALWAVHVYEGETLCARMKLQFHKIA